MKLTIAIPTYNRNHILKKNLILILPQLTLDCKLIIIDNASDKAVEDDLKDILDKYKDIDINIIRNRYNIGLTGNLLRCFELCEDPWLWILGDDDEVIDGSIKQILLDIKKYQEASFINYAWDKPSLLRKNEVITRGAADLIDKCETLGVILFISAGVYNIKKINKYLSFGNFFQTSYAPHLVMLFMSTDAGDNCILSNKQIVINKGFETPAELKWDQIFIYQITILLRLPLSSNTLQILESKLQQLTRVWTVYHLIFTLVHIGCLEKNSKRTLIFYDGVLRGFFYLDKRILSRVVGFIGYFIVKYPFLFNKILKLAYKCFRGREFQPTNNLRI